MYARVRWCHIDILKLFLIHFVPQDATQDLNFLLVERAPRDPPPPRRGNRKRQADDTVESSAKKPKKKAKTEAASPNSDTGGAIKENSQWQNLAAAIAAEHSKISETTPVDDVDATGGDTKTSKGASKKVKKKNRNVGGWVDPNFGKEVRRSWLQGDKYESNLDLSDYVPQIGDIIL